MHSCAHALQMRSAQGVPASGCQGTRLYIKRRPADPSPPSNSHGPGARPPRSPRSPCSLSLDAGLAPALAAADPLVPSVSCTTPSPRHHVPPAPTAAPAPLPQAPNAGALDLQSLSLTATTALIGSSGRSRSSNATRSHSLVDGDPAAPPPPLRRAAGPPRGRAGAARTRVTRAGSFDALELYSARAPPDGWEQPPPWAHPGGRALGGWEGGAPPLTSIDLRALDGAAPDSAHSSPLDPDAPPFAAAAVFPPGAGPVRAGPPASPPPPGRRPKSRSPPLACRASPAPRGASRPGSPAPAGVARALSPPLAALPRPASPSSLGRPLSLSRPMSPPPAPAPGAAPAAGAARSLSPRAAKFARAMSPSLAPALRPASPAAAPLAPPDCSPAPRRPGSALTRRSGSPAHATRPLSPAAAALVRAHSPAPPPRPPSAQPTPLHLLLESPQWLRAGGGGGDWEPLAARPPRPTLDVEVGPELPRSGSSDSGGAVQLPVLSRSPKGDPSDGAARAQRRLKLSQAVDLLSL